MGKKISCRLLTNRKELKMKKVSLLSLLAVMAISTGANANVENPLYMPAEGRLYSKTDISKQDSVWGFEEKVGYGFTNRFTMDMALSYQEDKDDEADGWKYYKIGGAYRLSAGKVLTDLYTNYSQTIDEDVFGDDFSMIDAGLRIGKRNSKYTVAANVGLNRIDIKDGEDSNNIAFGTDFVYNFDDRVSGQIGLDYILTDDFNTVAGEDDSFALTAQVNYLKGGLWSIYYTTELKADDVDDTFGFKYGVQF